MDCVNVLATHILEIEVIGRVLLLGIIIAINILVGYWMIDRVGKKQSDENIQHIDDLRETIRVLRKMS